MGNTQLRKYEEYAYVLDYKSRAKSTTVRGRIGVIVIALGEERLTLLEILGIENSTFDIGERIYIGKEGRTKVQSVLGKMDYSKTSDSTKNTVCTYEDSKTRCQPHSDGYPGGYAAIELASSAIGHNNTSVLIDSLYWEINKKIHQVYKIEHFLILKNL